MWTREAPSTRLNTNSRKSSSSNGKLPNWDTKSPQYPRQLKDEFLRSQRAILSLPQLYGICTELPEHKVLCRFPPFTSYFLFYSFCAGVPETKTGGESGPPTLRGSGDASVSVTLSIFGVNFWEHECPAVVHPHASSRRVFSRSGR
jgi:hypothetical protein